MFDLINGPILGKTNHDGITDANDMERESLVLPCQVLEILGDRYAIYEFSDYTHKRCELFRVNRFTEPYNSQVRARISGVLPQDYTRMGPGYVI